MPSMYVMWRNGGRRLSSRVPLSSISCNVDPGERSPISPCDRLHVSEYQCKSTFSQFVLLGFQTPQAARVPILLRIFSQAAMTFPNLLPDSDPRNFRAETLERVQPRCQSQLASPATNHDFERQSCTAGFWAPNASAALQAVSRPAKQSKPSASERSALADLRAQVFCNAAPTP